jgi:rare lipoprotein A
LAGKHSAQSEAENDRGPLRRSLPILAGTAVAAVVLISGAVVTFNLTGSSGGKPEVLASATVSDPADLDRNTDRADRGNRPSTSAEAIPSSGAPTTPPPSPSLTPTLTPTSPTPTAKRSTTPPPPPATTGSVTSTGSCQASYYATGSTTANGESFNPDGITAAHKTLPFNTRVRVTNLGTNSSVVVRINDRGPFVANRCIDLSRGAFKAIASLNAGVISIKYEVLA